MRTAWSRTSSIAGVMLALAALLAGCSVGSGTRAQPNAHQPNRRITLFPLAQDVAPAGLALGPDGNVWFTEPNQSAIVAITPAGRMTHFAVPGATPYAITAGPDGALWFADGNGPRLGRITTTGAVTEFALPEDRLSGIGGLAVGPDGNLWYTDGEHVGRVSPHGAVTTFSYPPDLLPAPDAGTIMAGPDGNLWIFDAPRSKLWRVTPRGAFDIVAVPAWPRSCCVATGPDGNLWAANYHDVIVLSTSGDTIYDYQLPAANLPVTITAGTDRALWFIEAVRAGDGPEQVRIARMALDGTLSEYPVPSIPALNPYTGLAVGPPGIIAGAAGAIWFLDRNAIGRLA